MSDPSNAELLRAIQEQGQAFRDHADDDHRFQSDQGKVNTNSAIFQAETEGKLAKLDEMPTKTEIELIVVAAMGNVLKSKGKAFYAGLLIVAGIVGALVVIGGGMKAALAFIGIHLVR